jgi:predicted RNA-binding protein with PIN domain
MRYLIDGYNLMYAGGLLEGGKAIGSAAFRKKRTRFLNDLAAALGALEAHRTTVVFDASNAPAELAGETSHKGLTVVYAVEAENADERIEQLIARHSSPKLLTVVSSDRRIRQAAERRGAKAVTADDFWVTLDALRARSPGARTAKPSAAAAAEPDRERELSSDETAHWLAEFGHLDHQPETREALGTDNIPLLTDDEIAQLEREIDREMGKG